MPSMTASHEGQDASSQVGALVVESSSSSHVWSLRQSRHSQPEPHDVEWVSQASHAQSGPQGGTTQAAHRVGPVGTVGGRPVGKAQERQFGPCCLMRHWVHDGGHVWSTEPRLMHLALQQLWDILSQGGKAGFNKTIVSPISPDYTTSYKTGLQFFVFPD